MIRLNCTKNGIIGLVRSSSRWSWPTNEFNQSFGQSPPQVTSTRAQVNLPKGQLEPMPGVVACWVTSTSTLGQFEQSLGKIFIGQLQPRWGWLKQSRPLGNFGPSYGDNFSPSLRSKLIHFTGSLSHYFDHCSLIILVLVSQTES